MNSIWRLIEPMAELSSSDPSAKRTVLVVGAHGFLGGFIVASLRGRGWRVLNGVRGARADGDERMVDLSRMLSAESWRATLVDVDGVVNVSGILRETGRQSFETIHVAAPIALASACVEAGINTFVQVSALGIAADGGFIESKHRFDERLLALPLRAVVLRPSVVYAVSGSYGGTSLLRALAAFPLFSLLPGDGRWAIQPVAAEDLAALVADAVEGDQRGVYEVGGPQPVTLRHYQSAWRRWLRISGNGILAVPEFLVSAQVWLGERLGRGPVGETMWRMLRRGNVTDIDACPRLLRDFGRVPRGLEEMLATQPSQVQDRWQAQLYFLAPLLRFSIVTLWLLSALAGWFAPVATIEALAQGSAMQGWPLTALARTTGILDFLLAGWLASGWQPRWAIALMATSVLTYTAAFGLLLHALWLEPLGGLAKNLVILPALALAWVLAERR